MRPNQIQFDNNALAQHQQTGNNIRSMLDALSQVEGTGENPDMTSLIEQIEDEKSFSKTPIVSVNPNASSNQIQFDNNALENHQQNGLKGTVKGLLASFLGAMAL